MGFQYDSYHPDSYFLSCGAGTLDCTIVSSVPSPFFFSEIFKMEGP